MFHIDYLAEGVSDLHAARKLIEAAGGTIGSSYYRPGKGRGKASIDSRLAGLNAGARYGRAVLVLRDLDSDASCGAELVKSLVPARHSGLLLRIAVRSAEAWYVADRDAYARYCGLPTSALPLNPEQSLSLKALIISMAESGKASRLGRHLGESRSRGVPDWASLGHWHADFVRQHWSPARAIKSGRVPSLERALQRLRERVSAA